MLKKSIFYFIAISFLISCGNDPLKREWIFPTNDIDSGLNENDDIPSINDPKFLELDQVNYLADSSQLIVIKHEGIIKAYPIDILEWHEVINDEIGGTLITVSHSTLSGMSNVWNREIQGRNLNFTASRFLYKNNQISFDRETLNYWSQLFGKSVSGNSIGNELELIPHMEMNWKGVKALFANDQVFVLSEQTGFVRDYFTDFPYGEYKVDSSDFIFDPDTLNNILPYKKRVLGIITDSTAAKVYAHSALSNSIELYQDDFNGKNILIATSVEYDFITAYEIDFGSQFSINNNVFEPLQDSNGNTYNIWGESVNGSNVGEVLNRPDNKMGYWFVWLDYFENISIY